MNHTTINLTAISSRSKMIAMYAIARFKWNPAQKEILATLAECGFWYGSAKTLSEAGLLKNGNKSETLLNWTAQKALGAAENFRQKNQLHFEPTI